MAKKVIIDNCSGCNLCADMYPEFFEMDEDENAFFIEGQDPQATEVREAAEICPVEAISIEEE